MKSKFAETNSFCNVIADEVEGSKTRGPGGGNCFVQACVATPPKFADRNLFLVTEAPLITLGISIESYSQ